MRLKNDRTGTRVCGNKVSPLWANRLIPRMKSKMNQSESTRWIQERFVLNLWAKEETAEQHLTPPRLLTERTETTSQRWPPFSVSPRSSASPPRLSPRCAVPPSGLVVQSGNRIFSPIVVTSDESGPSSRPPTLTPSRPDHRRLSASTPSAPWCAPPSTTSATSPRLPRLPRRWLWRYPRPPPPSPSPLSSAARR